MIKKKISLKMIQFIIHLDTLKMKLELTFNYKIQISETFFIHN